jgi:hypothetical protein
MSLRPNISASGLGLPASKVLHFDPHERECFCITVATLLIERGFHVQFLEGLRLEEKGKFAKIQSVNLLYVGRLSGSSFTLIDCFSDEISQYYRASLLKECNTLHTRFMGNLRVEEKEMTYGDGLMCIKNVDFQYLDLTCARTSCGVCGILGADKLEPRNMKVFDVGNYTKSRESIDSNSRFFETIWNCIDLTLVPLRSLRDFILFEVDGACPSPREGPESIPIVDQIAYYDALHMIMEIIGRADAIPEFQHSPLYIRKFGVITAVSAAGYFDMWKCAHDCIEAVIVSRNIAKTSSGSRTARSGYYVINRNLKSLTQSENWVCIKKQASEGGKKRSVPERLLMDLAKSSVAYQRMRLMRENMSSLRHNPSLLSALINPAVSMIKGTLHVERLTSAQNTELKNIICYVHALWDHLGSSEPFAMGDFVNELIRPYIDLIESRPGDELRVSTRVNVVSLLRIIEKMKMLGSLAEESAAKRNDVSSKNK